MPEIPEPIEPTEPIIPDRTNINVSPGRSPERDPLPPIPNKQPLRPSDPAPSPNEDDEPEPEPQPSGAGNGQPPPDPPPVGTPYPDDDEYENLPCVDDISRYHSFRNGIPSPNPRRPFGIVVSRSGYALYIDALRASHPGTSELDLREAAWQFIVTHQIHHFLVDRAVATLEATFAVAAKLLPQNVWQQFNLRHASNPHGYSTLEESLCCAYSIRSAKPKYRAMAKRLGRLQPGGYQQHTPNGQKIVTPSGKLPHQQAVSQLLSEYLNPYTRQHAPGLHGLMLYGNQGRGTKSELTIVDAWSRIEHEIEIHLAR